MRKGIVYKKRIRHRKDNEIVNINGKDIAWGAFKTKFFDTLDKKEVRGEKIGK